MTAWVADAQPFLGAEGERADRRSVKDGGAAPFEQLGLFLPAAIGGDAHGESIE